MAAITICKGATINPEEVKRVETEMAKLVENNDANHTMTIEVVLHNHNEYPKMMYKGKEVRSVDSADAETAAKKDGFGPYNHKAFTAKEA